MAGLGTKELFRKRDRDYFLCASVWLCSKIGCGDFQGRCGRGWGGVGGRVWVRIGGALEAHHTRGNCFCGFVDVSSRNSYDFTGPIFALLGNWKRLESNQHQDFHSSNLSPILFSCHQETQTPFQKKLFNRCTRTVFTMRFLQTIWCCAMPLR